MGNKRTSNSATRSCIFILLTLILFPFWVFANPEKNEVCETHSVMTLPWTICLGDSKKTISEMHELIQLGVRELERIDRWMSEWKPDSLVSRINANAGIGPVRVTDEAYDAISQSLEHSRLTGGAFDISFNAFFGLYSWKKGSERFPTSEEIKKLLPLVNYKNIILNKSESTVFLKEKGMKIGLGGMGEGWAIDRVAAILKYKKIQSGYVDASGGVYVWGVRPSGKLWTIGIGDPNAMVVAENGVMSKDVLFKMYTTDVAITTAGGQNKGFVKDGKHYHHIIDPKTGYSADQSLQVTAICKSATRCDFVDDGTFILGYEKGIPYAQKMGVEVVVVDPEGKVHLSSGLKTENTKWGLALKLNDGIDVQLR